MVRRDQVREPIAVLGMALRLPGGISTPEQFWDALATGRDLISTVPSERWDAASFGGNNPDEPGTTYDSHGGFISDIDAFDASFFGISSREASRADPQQRLLLELTWEALERSSINPQRLARSSTGIWIGMSNNDWARMLVDNPRLIDGYTGVGGACSVAAGRIAHFLGTYGPAEVIDTACSSSLVAVHHAVQSLRRGESDLAIVGGTNLILSPELHICFSRTGMLSRSGRCHTFDDAADGYVRGEACCVVVLKRLDDARRDGDPIQAIVCGTAVNQDGRSPRLTAPNVRAQQKVMLSALSDADLNASEVSYVEAHGTGTPLGDPMEFLSIGNVYGRGRSAHHPLRVGSVKTNLGHGEGAAGLTGFIKAVLMLQGGRGIAPHLHCSSPNSRIDWKKWPIEIPQTLTPWPDERDGHYAAVSSFGFSGTNAHVIVGSFRPSETAAGPEKSSVEKLLCISAADPEALRSLASLYVSFLRKTDAEFGDICRSAIETRAILRERLTVTAPDALTAANHLKQWLGGGVVDAVKTGNDETASQAGCGSLDQKSAAFLKGGMLSAWEEPSRRVALPLYPFHRERFWLGALPETQRRLEREQVWQLVCSEAARESQRGPLGWDPRGYPERWAALEKLTLAYAQNVLVNAGAFANGSPVSGEDVMRNCGFQKIYGQIVSRWLRRLAATGALLETNEKYEPSEGFRETSVESLWPAVEEALRRDPGMLVYLRRCGDLLQDVLTGRASALVTLFPDGSFDLANALYRESSEARYCNAIAANAIRLAVEGWGRKRNVRILELGAGTGATTTAVTSVLQPEQAEYWFTDVSELFLRRARQSLRDTPFLRYALLDLDREPEEQGIPVGYFDVVLAANVLHASRNLPRSLERVHRLLAPGGLLLLIETTEHQVCFDMTTGLIEGWQHFEDSERTENPLLNAQHWCEVLLRNGFESPMSFPANDSPASKMGQHVLIAKRDSSSSGSETILSQNRNSVQHGVRVPPVQPIAVADLSGLVQGGRAEAVATLVRQVVCRVCQLQVPSEQLSDEDRLGALGMDSLIALELRNELGKALGVEGKLSATIAFDAETIGELTRRITALLPADKFESPAIASDEEGTPQSLNREDARQITTNTGKDNPSASHAKVTASELLRNLRSRGVVLSVDQGRLSCDAPKGVMNAEIRSQLASQKQEILKLLSEPEKLQEERQNPVALEFPLSRSQRRLWFLDRMDPGNPVYNVSIGFRLLGPLNRGVFEEALRTILMRHESLRTHFRDHEGMPYALVGAGSDWAVDFHELKSSTFAGPEADLHQSMMSEAQRPFVLDKELLFRVHLYQTGENEHVALLVMHHIISDGWSISLLVQELGQIYEALIEGGRCPLPPLALQFRDFVYWEAEEENRVSSDDLAYWEEKLGGELPQLALPIDRNRPALQTFRGGRVFVDLSIELTEKLQKLARANNSTFFMVLSAAFSVLLRRYTRQEDILIGTPTAGRLKSGFESLIGFFVNNLVLRMNLTGNPSFVELLQRVRAVTLEAFEHQRTPFDQLVEVLQPERSTDRSPLFQVLFSLHNSAMPNMRFSELEMKQVDFTRSWARFDIAADVYPYESHFRCSFEFNSDIFDEETIQRMLRAYMQILDRASSEPDLPISRLALLCEAERREVIDDWNSTEAPLPPYASVSAWFRAQAQETPTKIALEMGDRSLTYGELDAHSDRIASDLRTRGVGRGSVVGLYMNRGMQMVVGLIGILKAGSAYLPLDPAMPPRRTEFLLSDSQVALILTERDLLNDIPATSAVLLPIEEAGVCSSEAVPDDVVETDRAYLIYTSGTTGNPKATEIHHQALVNLLGSMMKEPGLRADDTLVAVTTISFDIAGLEIFGPLLCGAKLVLASREQAINPELLADLLDTSGATVLQATPSTWRMLVESGWTGRTTLRMWCGGEALSPDLAESLVARGKELWNLYGPTETTIWSAVHRVRSGENPILIGRPIANTEMHILDDELQPVPVGVTGELFIGGLGVARGYWKRSELTAQRFLSDPFDSAGLRKLYRTGDLARYLSDGQIQLLGRTDHQIKLRGHRIEAGEIELAIERHPSVRQALVVLLERENEKQLVAYIRFEDGVGDTAMLRSWLYGFLPDYMVPSVLMPVDEFPQTPNGKIDRKRLPLPQKSPRAAVEVAAPGSQTERRVSEIWSHLLHVDKPGLRENFFDLGGHSLLLVQLHAQLKREFQVNIAVVDLFRHPTIATLATFLDSKTASIAAPIGADL
ncbi:MAG: amino acid adenylation domain-containing protein [Acidobacteria bacterium]|nr:amino acid adenylation domain-containing protein [Acidobacteriota bacterium]